jgi:hydrogenase 3 maturation protease
MEMKTTFTPSWQGALRRTLAAIRVDGSPRAAIVGIGSRLGGDDAAGAELADRLGAWAAGCENVLVIDGGPAPENVTGAVRRFRPDVAVLVDAVHFGGDPGAIAWVDWHKAEGLSASTHTLPLACLAQYLIDEMGCEVALLGIQPVHRAFGEPLSAAVRRAVNRLADGLSAILTETAPAGNQIEVDGKN